MGVLTVLDFIVSKLPLLLIVVLVPMIVKILLKPRKSKKISKQNESNASDIIKQSGTYIYSCYYAWIMYVVLMFFLLLELSRMIREEDYEQMPAFVFAVVIFTSISLMMAGIYVYTKNWLVEIYEDHFTYRNMWYHTKTYYFKDCELVFKSACYCVYLITPKKRKLVLRVSFSADGGGALTRKLFKIQKQREIQLRAESNDDNLQIKKKK